MSIRPTRPDKFNEPDGKLFNQLRTLLPLYGESLELPHDFLLDVPYIKQEKQYYCGAACAQMVGQFLGRSFPSQDEIMDALGAKDFRGLKHESFEVSLSDFAAKNAQVLPSHYSPAIHIAPRMNDGLAATDFIRGMPQMPYISRHDFYVFKRLLLARNAPIMVRIHFTTDLYPMDDEVAQFLDVTGHCLVIVGFNSSGFVVHDPWDAAAFGGLRGGSNQTIPYEELRDVTPMVNCSYEDEISWDIPGIHFEHLPKAVYPERVIAGRVVLYWPGIEGVPADRWVISEIIADFSTTSDIKFTNRSVRISDFKLRPGQTKFIPYEINTGTKLGSYQIKVDVRARLVSPVFPWVENHQPVNAEIETSASYRVSVQPKDWFAKYAMSQPIP